MPEFPNAYIAFAFVWSKEKGVYGIVYAAQRALYALTQGTEPCGRRYKKVSTYPSETQSCNHFAQAHNETQNEVQYCKY